MVDGAYGAACIRERAKGALVFLSGVNRRRGELMSRMVKGAGWTWQTVLYLCRLSTASWDKFMEGLDVYGAATVQEAANRTEIMARAMVREQGKEDFKYWWEDDEASEWSGDLPLDVAKGIVRGRGLKFSEEHLGTDRRGSGTEWRRQRASL